MTDEQNITLMLLLDKSVVKKCYVYFLINESNDIVYIGKSMNVIGRIGNHINRGVVKFCDYKVIEVNERDLNKVERRMIDLYLPFYNDDLKTQRLKREKMLVKIQNDDCGLNIETIRKLTHTLLSPGNCSTNEPNYLFIKGFERYLLGSLWSIKNQLK